MVDFRDSLQNTKESIIKTQEEITRREEEDQRTKQEVAQRVANKEISELKAKSITSKLGSNLNQLQKELRILEDKQRELERKQSIEERREDINKGLSEGTITKQTSSTPKSSSLISQAKLSERFGQNIQSGRVKLPDVSEVRISNLGDRYETTGVTRSLTLRDEQGKSIGKIERQERAVLIESPLLSGRQELQAQADQRKGLQGITEQGDSTQIGSIIETRGRAITNDQELLQRVNQGFERQRGEVLLPKREESFRPRPTIGEQSYEGFRRLDEIGLNALAQSNKAGEESKVFTGTLARVTAFGGGSAAKTVSFVEKVGQAGEPFSETGKARRQQIGLGVATILTQSPLETGRQQKEGFRSLGQGASQGKLESTSDIGSIIIGNKAADEAVKLGRISNTKVETTYTRGEFGTIGTKTGVLTVDTGKLKAGFEVTQEGLFKAKPVRKEIKEIEAEFTISSEEKALGLRDVAENTGIFKGDRSKQLSTAYSPARVFEGEINIKGQQPIKVEGIRTTQGEEIINIDDTTLVSRSQKEPFKFKGKDVIKTKTLDIKSGELTLTRTQELDKVLKSKALTDDIYVQGVRKYETDRGFTARELRDTGRTRERIIDTKVSSFIKPINNLKTLGYKEPISIIKPTKIDSNKFDSQIGKGQTQIFKEQTQVQEPKFININQQVAKLNKEPTIFKESKPEFKGQDTRLTGLQIPKSTIEKIVFKDIKGQKGLGSALSFSPVSISSAKISSVSGIKQSQAPTQQQTFKTNQTFKTISETKTQQQFKQELSLSTASSTRSAQKLDQKISNQFQQKETFKVSTPFKISIPTSTPSIPFFRKEDKLKSGEQQGYNVYVRERGKEVKLNKNPLPINKATKFLEYSLDNSVQASGELRKTTPTRTKDVNYTGSPFKFTTRKTKNALRVVERNRFRIDSRGEQLGLKASKVAKSYKVSSRGFKL